MTISISGLLLQADAGGVQLVRSFRLHEVLSIQAQEKGLSGRPMTLMSGKLMTIAFDY